ncbi:MAG: hypothetical protein OXT74_18620 [Candidatus Poribacteria bacterium]|nr:hypothetical protein [Candidatus Poribacteria bacterium]
MFGRREGEKGVMAGNVVGSYGMTVTDGNGAIANVCSDYIRVSREEKTDMRAAQFGINEHGGFVGVFGIGNTQSRALMGVNEYGDGAISTWWKDGERRANLK